MSKRFRFSWNRWFHAFLIDKKGFLQLKKIHFEKESRRISKNLKVILFKWYGLAKAVRDFEEYFESSFNTVKTRQ